MVARESEPAPRRPDVASNRVPDPDSAACQCRTESFSCPTGEILVVRVSGDIDQMSEPTLAAALTVAVAAAPRHLLVDLAAVTFCSGHGLGMLVSDTAPAATARGTRYALTGLSAHLNRVCSVLWGTQLPVRCYRSVAGAVTAIRSAEAGRPRGRRGDHGGSTRLGAAG